MTYRRKEVRVWELSQPGPLRKCRQGEEHVQPFRKEVNPVKSVN